MTSHTFRKTVASRLDDAGFSIRHIADQLGHARPSTTLDHYLGRRAVTTCRPRRGAVRPGRAASKRFVTGSFLVRFRFAPPRPPDETAGHVGPVGLEPTTRGLKVFPDQL